MRFLHVFPSFEASGAQLRVATIVNALDSTIDHEFLAMDGNYQAASHLRQNRVELLKPFALGGTAQRVRAFGRLLAQRRPDLLLTYNWGAMDAVVAAKIGRYAPVVHNECGLDIDEESRLLARRVWLRRMVLPEVECVIATSHSMEQLVREEFGVPARKARFIRTGVNIRRFQPWHRQGGRELVFGFVGGLRAVKNVPLLLDAFARAKIAGARLSIFGDGAMRPMLEEQARASGIHEQVTFGGYEADPAPCYAAMDVFVMTSVSEQTPNALLEAMASGLPAICTDVGDCRYLLGPDDPVPVAASRDAAGLAEWMRRLAAEPELREELGQRNRDRCVRDHSVQRMVAEYEAVYREAVGKAR